MTRLKAYWSNCRHRPDLVLLVFALTAGAFLRLERAAEADTFGGANYYALGLNLRTQGVLAFPTNPRLPSAYRGPLYPSFIAALLPKKEVPFPRLVLYVQALLGTLAIAGLYLLGGAVHSRLAGALAATAYAFNADQIAYGASLEIEHFCSLLLLSVACALVCWLRRPSNKSTWILGLAIGFSLNCRSTLFLFTPFLLAACLLRPHFFHKNAKRQLALVLLCSALTLSPWIARNALHFRTFIPFERFAAACNLFTASEGMVGTLLPSQAQAIASAGDRSFERMDEDGKNRELSRRAAANIFVRPGSYLWSSVVRAAFVVCMHPWLWGLSLLALWLNRHQRRLLPLAYLAAYFLGIHSLLSVEGRYFIPLIPILIVIAASGLASAALSLSRRFHEDWKAYGKTSSLGRLSGALRISMLIFGAAYAVSLFFLAAECRRSDLRLTTDILPNSEGIFPQPVTDRARFYNDRGVQRFFARDLSGAEADFRQASRLKPRFIEPYLSLGAVLSRQGRHQDAIRACAKAWSLTMAEDASPSAQSKEWHVLLTLTLECCANESQALGRPEQARLFTEASRRSTIQIADRLRSLAGSPRAERSR
ncbi:MAG: glycosyltransferase family 39 protein [Elusimicrobiota bacterium]